MLIQHALLVDPIRSRKADVRIENGVIDAVEDKLPPRKDEDVLDAEGLVMMPAFIDLHAHFRSPGYEYKEDITSGSRAAARGGYTFVNCMANTHPVCSSPEIVRGVETEAKCVGLVDVNQTVSITKDFDGKTLSHLDLFEDGTLRVISDDGHGVQDNAVMWHAMQLAAQRGITILSHAEDSTISKEDYRLAENIETARNLLLAAYTGAKLHLCHVSTKEAMKDILRSKKRGESVTCEVTPHHIWFYNEPYRVNPPIRAKDDVDFLIAAILSGAVDAIATDHAPHTDAEKRDGAPGMVGLETAFSVCYTKLCAEYNMPLERLSSLLTRGPAKVLGLQKGLLQEGSDGDIVLVDLERRWVVDKDLFAGKSHNTPFDGVELRGKVVRTIKAGKTTYCEEDEALAETGAH